ncbi:MULTISPECIES: DUF2514 family protein [Giesbergeria]|uniref:DUF2514 family protein n=1 Tax=Giesbergeria sinuosa TaxID=80883 RepID=A0ABV9QBF1_9BURK
MTTSVFWPIVALILALGLYVQGQQLHQAQTHAAELEHQQDLAWAQKKNLETQHRHDTEQKDKETQAAIAVAHADADRARAVSVGLQHDLAGFIEAHRHRAQAATAAGQCAPDDSAALVLADLFSRADARAGELAAAFDESLARGNGCADTYDAAVAISQEQ